MATLTDVGGLRILLLNWRDYGHPRAGGAEVYVHEVAERLSRAGAIVTLFSSTYPGAPAAELRRGVRIIRRGGTLAVYFYAALHLGHSRKNYDVVIDFQNGIPFFSPLLAASRSAVVLVIHHVHQDQFALHFSPLMSHVGRLLEGPLSRWVYGHRPVIAVSPSTRREIRRRLGLRGPVHIVPNGLSAASISKATTRSPAPHIVVVSRLISHKRFHLLIDAMQEVRRHWPSIRLDIAGDGPERLSLEARVAELGLNAHIRFHGFVPDSIKEELLGSAWITVSPSQNEGWGLTVLEANSAGVPAVAFDVPGLTDSIIDGVTGWLIPEGASLADAITRALAVMDGGLEAAEMRQRCFRWASRFSWDETAQRLATVALVEFDRARTGTQRRRRHTDLAARIDIRLTQDPLMRDVVREVKHRVRRSDRLDLHGEDLRLLLFACDERGALHVLGRLGQDLELSSPIRLATTTELLAGLEA